MCTKFADDSAIVGLLSDAESERSYSEDIVKFYDWCSNHYLELNVTKTKELVIDPRRGAPKVNPVTIGGEVVEMVDTFRYLGLTLDTSLSFKKTC